MLAGMSSRVIFASLADFKRARSALYDSQLGRLEIEKCIFQSPIFIFLFFFRIFAPEETKRT